MPKALTVWITADCGEFFKRWEYQTTWPASWEICLQIRRQQLELDMEQQTDSKTGKEYVKAVYCHPAYLTYMQSTSWETLGWMKHKRIKIERKWKWSHSVVSDSLWPHGLYLIRLLRPWDFPGKSAGVDCHFLLQGIFPTQESNPGLPLCRQTLYHLSHQGSQGIKIAGRNIKNLIYAEDTTVRAESEE